MNHIMNLFLTVFLVNASILSTFKFRLYNMGYVYFTASASLTASFLSKNVNYYSVCSDL